MKKIIKKLSILILFLIFVLNYNYTLSSVKYYDKDKAGDLTIKDDENPTHNNEIEVGDLILKDPPEHDGTLIYLPSCVPDVGCSCSNHTADGHIYLDREAETCIGETEVSKRESINMNNIKNISQNFDFIRQNLMSEYNYLPTDLKQTVIGKLNTYYNNNSSMATSTIESISRSQRDAFFTSKYTPYLGLSKSINILAKYDDLGNSLQNLIYLLNTTEAYIRNSAIDMSEESALLLEASSELSAYKNEADNNLTLIGAAIYDLDVDDSVTFVEFARNFNDYKEGLNILRTKYFSLKDGIIEIAIQAIQKVEAVYNKNSSITASPEKIYNDGSVSIVTVTVRDSLNNPVANKLVTLTGTKSTIVISISQNTNVNGVAEFSVSSNNIGYISLVAEIEGADFEISGSYLIEVIENLAKTGCESSGGEWKDKNCICPEGYIWDEKELLCINLAEQGCENSGGSWNGTLCICKPGFVWSQEQLVCVMDVGVAPSPEEGCESTGGRWNGITCDCPEGTMWDSKLFICVESSSDMTEEICIKGGGIWNGEKCKCEDGFIWNEKESKCIKN